MAVSTPQESLMPEGWETKRKHTFVIFCFMTFVVGIEWGIIVPTSYHYMKNVIKAEHSNIWYGFTVTGYWAMAIIGSLTISRYSDYTRNICRSVIFICTIAVLGNFIYVIPFSPVFPLIGRSLQGVGDSLISVLTGEIIRIFPEELVMKKISLFVTMLYAAMIISPSFVVLFQRVYVNVLSIPLGPSNSPSVFVGCMWLICLLLTFVFIVDLSKIYDLKMEQSKNRKASEMVEKESNGANLDSKQSIGAPITTKTLFRNEMFCFILLISSLTSYSETVNASMILPAVVENYYHLSTNFTAVLLALTGVTFLVFVFILSKINQYRSEVYFVIMGLCGFAISYQSLIFSLVLADSTKKIGIVCLTCYFMTQGIGFSVSQVLLATIVAQLIPSSTQSFAEGIRRSIKALSSLLAGVIGGFVQLFLIEHAFVVTALFFCFVVYLLVKRRQYCNIEMISDDGK